MAATRIAAWGIAAVLLLAGCSSDDDPTNVTGIGKDGPPPTKNIAICTDPDIHPEAWAMVCGGQGKQPTKTPQPGPIAPLGQPAATAGDTGWGDREAGTLEILPGTVVYATGADTGSVPERDGYVVIAAKLTNTGTVPSQALGTTSAWTYTAPDGEQVSTAVSLSARGFNVSYSIVVEPGTFQQTVRAWGIRNDQRGGVLTYTDGARRVFRWQLPAVDSGPQAAELKKALK